MKNAWKQHWKYIELSKEQKQSEETEWALKRKPKDSHQRLTIFILLKTEDKNKKIKQEDKKCWEQWRGKIFIGKNLFAYQHTFHQKQEIAEEFAYVLWMMDEKNYSHRIL